MAVLLNLCRISHYGNPDDSNRVIARHLLRNLDKLKKASIQEAADFCYVSVASVSRFIRSAGYSSFSEFRQALSYELDSYNYLTHSDIKPQASLDETIEGYLEESVRLAGALREELDRETLIDMADAMYGKKKVYIYSFFFLSALPYLQVDLSLSGKSCEICEVEVEQRRTIQTVDPDSYLLVVKNQNADTRYMDDLIRQAKTQGAEIGIIQNGKNSTVLDCADHVLTFTGTNTAVDSAVLNNCATLLSVAYRKRYLNV